MGEMIITNEDLQYLASTSSDNLNMILSGMISLMEENNDNIHMLENQNWFQRMSNTISGKNKMVQQDIAHNHDKINLYVTEALGQLYSQNCIDHEIILGLGNKVNELYEKQVEIKQIIGAFVQKLNEKIESIDNYHMLIEEVNQGVYSCQSPFVSISKIMSQLDLRTVKDNRKMEILMRAMREQKIIEDEEIPFSLMLEETLKLSDAEAGVLALFFGNIRDEYVAEIAEKTIYAYYMLPEKIRKMKSKHSIVESVLKENDIDIEYSVSSAEMCETLIQAYIDNVIEISIEEQKNEEDEKREYITEYIECSRKLLILLRDMVPTWEANHGELNTHASRKEYAEFMGNVIDNLDRSSYIGSSIINNLNNMTFWAQNIYSKHEELRINEAINDDIGISVKVNRNAALGIETDEINTDSSENIFKIKYQTITEYYIGFLSKIFKESDKYSLRMLDTIAEEFPSPLAYQGFYQLYMNIKNYIFLYNTLFNNVINRLDDNVFLNEIFELCKRFPVRYESDYNNVLIRDFDFKSVPHIELEYKADGRVKGKTIGYANLGFLKDYETTTVIVRLVNVNIQNYTVNYHIIKNGYLDMSTWKQYKYVDVEWGDWIESNALELKITKNNSESFGELAIRVRIKQDPEIVAYIESN